MTLSGGSEHKNGEISGTSKHNENLRAMLTAMAKLVGAALGLVLNVVVAHSLTLQGYGIFVLAQTLVVFVAMFASAGMPFSAVRFIPGYHARGEYRTAQRFRRTSLIVTWLGSGIVIAIGATIYLAVGDRLSDVTRLTMLVAIPLVLVFALTQTYAALAQARFRLLEAEVLQNVLRPLLAVGAVLVLVHVYSVELAPHSALLIFGGAGAVSLLCLSCYYRHLENSEPRRAPPADAEPDVTWRSWLGAGLLILLVLSGASLNERLDIMMISALSGTEETALYAAASRFALISTLMLTGISGQFLPRFSQAFALGDAETAARLARQAARLAALLAGGVLAFALLGGELALALFGPEFRAGHLTLVLLSVSYLGMAVFGISGGIAVVCGAPKVVVQGTGLGIVVNFALNLALTPTFGAEGAATATIAALLAANFFFWSWCRRTLGYSTAALGKRL